MIPQKNSPFWVDLVKEKTVHDFPFFALKLYISETIQHYKEGKTSLDEAATSIYSECVRFSKINPSEFQQVQSKQKPHQSLLSLQEVTEMILTGKKLLVFGSDELLTQLPSGNWIGTTMPYFMTDKGGLMTTEELYVEDLTQYVAEVDIRSYSSYEVLDILNDRKEHGFSYLLMPFNSKVSQNYAMTTLNHPDLYRTPIFGFIGGGIFEDLLSGTTPYTYNGSTGEKSSDRAMVMHVEIFSKYFATVDIVNIFKPDLSGDVIEFEESGYNVRNCYVNGKRTLLTDYFKAIDYDKRTPFMVDYGGAYLNASVLNINYHKGEVLFASPITTGRKYYRALDFEDYERAFEEALPKNVNVVAGHNCLYNYFHGNFKGKKIDIHGPFTYGEIAYKLLNQTLVYLRLES